MPTSQPSRRRSASRPVSTFASRALREQRRFARLELALARPVDVKPDPWQRLIAIGSILSVLVLAVGLYITNDANREQHRLAEQGQITERFTKAVEQLGQPGPDKIDVRLGAIYALERIMRDSAEDHPAVVQVLAAFIRVHAPAPTASPTRSEDLAEPTPPPPPPVDIQAALTVLGRRNTDRDRLGDRLNLARTNLAGADLSGADLSTADLSGANLAGADLFGADLSGANLADADLGGTNLTAALLNDADLRYADLANAELRSALLFGANLAEADLRHADLGEARGVTSESVRLACLDDDTKLPPEVARPPAEEYRAHCRPQNWKLLPPKFSERAKYEILDHE